jgi:hypothetical protein
MITLSFETSTYEFLNKQSFGFEKLSERIYLSETTPDAETILAVIFLGTSS